MCLKQNITQETRKEDWLKIKVEVNKLVSLQIINAGEGVEKK